MADGENLSECPVCSQDYQVEGEHAPCILCCFHTVCEQCIRGKLMKGTSLECPQCGAEHSGGNGTESIRRNEYIISYLKKVADKVPEKKEKPMERKTRCQKHGKEQILFCQEPGCQMPICVPCLKNDHDGHKICDLEEIIKQKCTALLEDVRLMKETLQKKKEDYRKVKKVVAQNCQDCTLYVSDLKADLISEINHKAANLVQEITEQKDNVDSRINNTVTNIDEKLAMVKDFEKIAQNKAIFEVERKKLEKFRSTKDEIQSRFSETTRYNVLTFMKCCDISNCLSKLFGKRIQKNKVIGMEMGAAVANKTDLHKVKEKEVSNVSVETKVTASKSKNHRGNNTDACSQQQKTRSMNPSGKTIETAVSVLTDISNKQSDVGAKEATENVLRRRASGQIAKVGPLKESAKMPTELLPSTDTVAADATHGNSLPVQKDGEETNFQAVVNNIQPTVANTQVTEGNTIQGLSTEVANNQLAKRNTVYNQPLANNAQPAVNATGPIPQTTKIWNRGPVVPLLSVRTVQPEMNAAGFTPQTIKIWNRGPVVPLLSAKNVQPAVNATGLTPQTTNTLNNQMSNGMVILHCLESSIAGQGHELSKMPWYSQAAKNIKPQQPFSNIQSVESNSVFNQPSTSSRTTTIQPATNTVANLQPVDNNTSKDSGTSNTIGKMSGDPRKSRSRLYGVSIDGGDNDDSEPVAKKARLEPTPDEDSQTNHPWSLQVVQFIRTGFEQLNVMGLLPENTILVSGKGCSRWPSNKPGTRPSFVKYNRLTGERLWSVLSKHTDTPVGMAVVTGVTGENRLALSYSRAHMIEFYDVNNLRTTLQSYSAAPDYPGRLFTCPFSPGTLVYTSCQRNKQVVKWLDCTNSRPSLKDAKTNIQVELAGKHFIQDMCFVSHGEKDLLVTTHNHGGVHAYIARTDKLEWRVSNTGGGHQPGVINAVGITTNGHGQLFICDAANCCIQMFSTDGTFLGTVLKSGDQMLGNPLKIRWCNKTRSLLVAHSREKKGLSDISIFRC